jgi:hypothetical protein
MSLLLALKNYDSEKNTAMNACDSMAAGRNPTATTQANASPRIIHRLGLGE